MSSPLVELAHPEELLMPNNGLLRTGRSQRDLVSCLRRSFKLRKPCIRSVQLCRHLALDVLLCFYVLLVFVLLLLLLLFFFFLLLFLLFLLLLLFLHSCSCSCFLLFCFGMFLSVFCQPQSDVQEVLKLATDQSEKRTVNAFEGRR